MSIDLADPSELSVTAYLKTVATDPRNYLFVAFGFASFVGSTVVFSLGLALAATPFVYWIPGVEYNLMEVGGSIELGDEHEHTYPQAMKVTDQNGDDGRSGPKQTGYAAYGLEDPMPTQVARIYEDRSRIEKSHEKVREARDLNTAPSTIIRLFYVE